MKRNGHSTACASAKKTTPQQCGCSCEGGYHGGPNTQRARALVRDEAKRKSYSKRQVIESKKTLRNIEPNLNGGALYRRRATDYLVTGFVDLLIRTTSPEAARLDAAIRAAVSPFAKAIVDANLGTTNARNAKDFINSAHLLCSLCVSLLQLDDALQALTDAAADAIVDTVLGDAEKSPRATALTAAARTAVRSALAQALNPLRAATLPSDPISLRLAGVLFCPDISEHTEVNELCLKPLSTDFLIDEIAAWVESGFAGEPPQI